MLEIHEQADLQQYADLLAVLRLSEPPHVAEAMVEGRVAGYAVFAYQANCVTLYACEAGGDLLLLDGIVRTVFLKASMRGLHRAVFAFSHPDLVRLHFLAAGETVCEEIDTIMNGCESCKRK